MIPVLARAFFWFWLLLLESSSSSVAATSDPISDQQVQVEFDCKVRRFAYEFAHEKIPWAFSSSSSDETSRQQQQQQQQHQMIHDALRLNECTGIYDDDIFVARSTSRHRSVLRQQQQQQASAKNTNKDKCCDHHIFVDPVHGDDRSSGTINRPLQSLVAARDLSRSMRQNNDEVKDTSEQTTINNKIITIFLREGYYYINESFELDSRDNCLTIQAYRDESPVISGGDLLSLTFEPTTNSSSSSIYSAQIPKTTQHSDGGSRKIFNFTLLFFLHHGNNTDDDIRLIWAREPNGHPEHDLQPDGYGRVNGTTAKRWPDPSGAIHMPIKEPKRNSTTYPWFGEDLDPRGKGSSTWFHIGGPGDRFVDRKGFWNGTISMGIRYAATYGSDDTLLKVDNWTSYGYAPAIAHVFHNAFWGNWQFKIANVDAQERTISFSEGGWQEGRGGGMGHQPFFIEGVKEALDSPGEWWLDVPEQILYYYPFGNETSEFTTARRTEDGKHKTTTSTTTTFSMDLVAPRLKRLFSVVGDEHRPAKGIKFRGLTFAHTATTFMDPYEVPSPGDWSIRRDGALFAENAEDLQVQDCRFLRTGGNAVFLSGHVKRVAIERNEFAWIGDNAIATVGRISMIDGFTVDTFPEDTYIYSNHFHEIGIHGKQTSALFSALSCRTSFLSNVAYNGPRAGININDQFCHGHTIEDNLLFNWVRETQDHGPLNTWDRAMYLQVDRATTMPTLIPEWAHIKRNFIMNGPSGNRDLGNLFPAIDNDDGSSYYRISKNFMVYGGAKNFLGHDKIWVENLIMHPGRWSGDPCAMLWAGENHYFVNNTCILVPGTSNEPIGLDGSTEDFSHCKIDWNDDDNLRFVGRAAKNTYYIDSKKGPWGFDCGNGTVTSHFFTLEELQRHGWETGSVALDVEEMTANAIIALAREILTG